MRVFALAVVALAAFLFSGCTPAQLKSDEAAAAADLNTAGTLLIGVGTAALNNPATMAEVAVVGNAVLQKAGVPTTTANKITAALNAKDAAAVVAAGTELKAFAAGATPTAQDPPEEGCSTKHCGCPAANGTCDAPCSGCCAPGPCFMGEDPSAK